MVSFRREWRTPKGGPDGGDGGDGGNVVFTASHHLNGLGHLQTVREISAKDGGKGLTSDCAGKNAPDTVVEVPVGTIIHELIEDAPPPRADDGEVHAPRRSRPRAQAARTTSSRGAHSPAA